jgi:prophage antirepressor-like protein
MESTKAGRENYQLVPFTFENHTVRTVVFENEPWFIAKDVCDVLGISNPRSALSSFPDNERANVGSSDVKVPGFPNRGMLTVNEPGLYRLVFQSRKSEAEKFKTWVLTEVLPSIRRTGMFLPEGMDVLVRRTVTDVVTALEREAIARRGTLLSDEERRFITNHAGYPVWRIAALTGRGEGTIRRLLKTADPAQPSLFGEATT